MLSFNLKKYNPATTAKIITKNKNTIFFVDSLFFMKAVFCLLCSRRYYSIFCLVIRVCGTDNFVIRFHREMIKRLPRIEFSAHAAFAVLAFVFGAFFVFSTPLLWGADETSHVGRVYQITQGHMFPRIVHQGYSGYGFGGTIPSNLMKVVDYVNTDFNSNHTQIIDGVKWVDNPSDYKKFSNLPLNGRQLEYNFSNTAVYSPVSYLPSIFGFKLAELFNLRIGPTIYMARFASLLFYVTLVTFVIRSMAAIRAKWIIFAVALVPMAVFQSGTITGDTVTIALAITIVGIVIKSLIQKTQLSKSEFILLTFSLLLLPLAKPSYLFLTLIGLLVPASSLPIKKYARYFIPLIILLGVVLFALWQYKTRYMSNAPKWIIAGVVPWWEAIDSSKQIKFVIHNPFTYLHAFARSLILADNEYFNGMFGKMGFDYVQVPATAIVASFLSIVAAVLGSEKFDFTKKGGLIVLAAIAMSVSAVFGILYLTITSVGFTTIQGVQGRYLFPILPAVVFLCAYTIKARINHSKSGYKNLIRTIIALSFISLSVSAIKFFYITWG